MVYQDFLAIRRLRPCISVECKAEIRLKGGLRMSPSSRMLVIVTI